MQEPHLHNNETKLGSVIKIQLYYIRQCRVRSIHAMKLHDQWKGPRKANCRHRQSFTLVILNTYFGESEMLTMSFCT